MAKENGDCNCSLRFLFSAPLSTMVFYLHSIVQERRGFIENEITGGIIIFVISLLSSVNRQQIKINCWTVHQHLHPENSTRNLFFDLVRHRQNLPLVLSLQQTPPCGG